MANHEDMNITRDEFNKIQEAFQNDEFKKLFFDYCEEMQNPESRKLYEQEIIQLEAERGVECKFVHPEPGFVIKTSVDGKMKGFINIASNKLVERPRHEIKFNEDTGRKALSWQIPYLQGQPHNDYDQQHQRCSVYDVVFHPDALHLASRNKNFRTHLIDTACDAVEREFKILLDRTNLKFPKLKYKGLPKPTVIRKLLKNAPQSPGPNPLDSYMPPMPESEEKAKPKPVYNTKEKKREDYKIPKYQIKYRRDVDYAEMTYHIDAKLNTTVPKEIVIDIDLPLLNSTADCSLDVTQKNLFLISEKPAKYQLKINLPYIVNDKLGSAKFDKVKKKLTVVLPVSDKVRKEVKDLYRENNCIDTDAISDTTSNATLDVTLDLTSNPILDATSDVNLDANSDANSDVYSDAYSDALSDAISDGIDEPSSLNSSPLIEVLSENSIEDYSKDYVEKDDISVSEISTDSEIMKVLDKDVQKDNNDFLNFLQNSIQYNFPKNFDCNFDDENLVFILHIKNVEPDSIMHLQTEKSIHVKFSSIGAGYYPIHYSFYCQLECDTTIISKIIAEPGDQNLIITLKLINGGELEKFSAGVNSGNVKLYDISEKCLNDNFTSALNEKTSVVDVDIKSNECGDGEVEINIKSKNPDNIIESNHTAIPEHIQIEENGGIFKKKKNKKNKKHRSYSESECDDLKSFDVHVKSSSLPCKGILKRCSRYGRSISESYSSMDESYSCSVEPSESIPNIPEEDDSINLSDSCKKTVRFSEVIHKQLFRLDSSILGQKKKNQKRKMKKQRRRNSEGDSADYDEKPSSPKSPTSFELVEKKSKFFKHTTNIIKRSDSDSDDIYNKNNLMFELEI